MKKIREILFTTATLLILLIVFCNSTIAQHQSLFINSTETDGLSDNRITCFYKDKTGYMWIGTENGLNRFDGSAYKIYQPSLTKKNNLSNPFITAIAQDKQGHIWVATNKGLNRIDASKDTTEFILSDRTTKDPLINESIWDVYPDTDTSVWVSIDAKQFLRYNPKTKQGYYFDFKNHLWQNNIEYTPSYHSIFKIISKSVNELWLATTDGIFSFNKTSGIFKLEYGVALDEITFFYYEPTTGKLYCADERKVLYIHENFTKKTVRVSLDASINRNKYLEPYITGKDGIFIPAPQGLTFINKQNEVTAFITGAANKENELLPGKITAIYKDREDISWIGTTKGISRFIPLLNNNLRISFPQNLQYDPEYALKNFIYNQNNNEWLVASYADSKIWRVNNTTGTAVPFVKPAAYKADICYSFYSRHPDTLYLLCDGSLLTWYNKENKWTKINLPYPYNKASLTCMAIDSEGNYWMGTRRKGLLIYNPVSKKIWSPSIKELDAAIVHAVQFDITNNCIWIGSYSTGLYQYVMQNKTFIRILRNDNLPNAFHSSLINDIAADGKGNIWSATLGGGLSKYVINTGITNYDLQNGLPDNNVYSIATAINGDVYFTTAKGIGCIKVNGKLNPLLNKQSGLPYSKFQQSLVCLHDGKIATTVDNDLFCFDAVALTKLASYKIAINEIIVNDSISINTNAPIFNHNQNNIRFDFALLNFTNPAAVEYFYWLEGFDKNWVTNGNRRSVRYGELPPGKYTFRIKAKSINDDVNKQVAEWQFEIQPPFWKSWWFRLIVAALIFTGIIYFIKKRFAILQQREKIKREHEKKIAEVEMQALRAQMNPHFMFNSLNSINNFILKNDADNASGYLTKFSRLMRLILDNSRSEWVLLENELKALDLYIELEAVRFDNSFTYSIQVEPDISIETVAVPPMLIQPYVENAIWHGLLHRKETGGKLLVHVWKQNQQLQIEIKDNGVGREEAKRLKSKTATKQKSHGMKITAERMEIVNKVYNVNAGAIITDLNDEKGDTTGTKILLTLQYKMYDSHYSG